MADFIRVSNVALEAIPAEDRFLAHQMYEDIDIDGANKVEATFDFIERKCPGLLVAILANDSVTPRCCSAEGHFPCDFYAPDWYTVFILRADWVQYQAAVMARDALHKAAHQCKIRRN